MPGGGGKTLTTSCFKRFSLASCALILSLSNVSMADETTTQTPQPEREKAYTLTRVEAEGENTITKIELNTETGKFEPLYYRIDLARSEYGNPGAENVEPKYFSWNKYREYINHAYVLSDTDDPSNAQFTYYADSQRLSNKIKNIQDGSSINNDFVGIKTSAGVRDSVYGGAIENTNSINTITGDFIDNYVRKGASTSNAYAYGGAIYNSGEINSITGNFILNSAWGSSRRPPYTAKVYGGAIYNSGKISNIVGDFINNSAMGINNSAGGAIYNSGKISNIAGNFIANFSELGGAIDNRNSIDSIAGDFIGNYVSDSNDDFVEMAGGAINNSGEINSIRGDFIFNSVFYDQGLYVSGEGGAIANHGSINDISGDFIGNSIDSTSYALGGAISNIGYIDKLTGVFSDNSVSTVSDAALGGAIYNSNYTVHADANVSFIYSVDFVITDTGERFTFYEGLDTEALAELESKIQDGYKVVVVPTEEICTSEQWAAMQSNLQEYLESGYLTLNPPVEITYDEPKIYIDDIKHISGNQISLVNANFINNTAKSEAGAALGGAIFSGTKLSITADNGVSVFSGNKTISQGKEEQNAIGMYGLYGIYDAPGPMSLIEAYDLMPEEPEEENPGFLDSNYNKVSENPAELELKAVNNGVILFDDTIRGGAININTGEIMETPETAYKLKITGDKTGKVVFNNSVINAKATLDEVTLHLTKADILATSTLTANSGHLSLLNGLAETQSMQGMTVNGHLGMSVDVDLANKSMDRLPENVTTVAPDGKIDVEYLNLLNDAKEDRTDILFAEESYKDKVSYTGKSPVAYSPIYKYAVSYNQDDGFFTFLRSSGGGNPSDAFNPTVLAPSVAAQAGAYATQMNTFNYAFQHSDNFMNLPFLERLALKESGRYASTTTNSFSPLYTRIESAGYWVKPYVSFESIPLKNGPKVDNINYGSLIGYDSKITPIAHGFDRVLSGYVGYNGASQSYSGVDSYQNGGLVGGTVFLYKGNFFNATTLSVGASVGESQNMYGNENYTMLLAGIGNRLGYNFEFKEGRYIIQPSMLMSYTFVNTFDYTNSAGVRMESDPLHAIQLAPGVKFIMNTKNGWQPYAAVNMVWNVLDKSDVRANDVRLPEMSIKPYVQYGLGVQKRIKDCFLAFGQAMVSNGGRNGVSLSFGLRWFLGGG